MVEVCWLVGGLEFLPGGQEAEGVADDCADDRRAIEGRRHGVQQIWGVDDREDDAYDGTDQRAAERPPVQEGVGADLGVQHDQLVAEGEEVAAEEVKGECEHGDS